jgi:hypothetical protein
VRACVRALGEFTAGEDAFGDLDARSIDRGGPRAGHAPGPRPRPTAACPGARRRRRAAGRGGHADLGAPRPGGLRARGAAVAAAQLRVCVARTRECVARLRGADAA